MAEPEAQVNGILEDIAGWIAYVVQLLRDWIGNLVSQAITWITGVISQLATWLSQALNAVIKWISDTFAVFVKWLQDLLAPIIKWLRDAWEAIYNFTVEVLQKIGSYISDLIAWVKSVGEAVISTVVEWISEVAAYVASIVDGVIGGILAVVETAKNAVVGFVTGIATEIAAIIAKVVATVQQAWTLLVTGAEAIIKTIAERLADVRDAFADLATDVVKAVSDLGDEYVKPIRETFKSFAEAYIPQRDEPSLAEMIATLRGTRTDPGQMEIFRQFWRDGFQDLAKRGPVYQTVFSFLFLLLTIIPSVVRIGGVLTESSVQEWNRQFPWQVLGPADAAQAWRHGLISDGTAKDEMRRAGYDEARAEQILKITAIVPPEGDLLSMHLRAIIDDPLLESALRQRGYDAQWTAKLRQAVQVIPPVQDLILMAVRDVWNPAAVKLGLLEESYPAELGEWSAKHGLNPDWARKYWAAHWSLPSPQQGFEMLHRGVIKDEELDTLLQALDIAPGWRPRLKAIAYSPYTRVDIRRMHQMKVLKDEEVLQAHRELGYDDEKAQKLTDFVIGLNKSAVTEDDVELGKLSRSAILGFYEDGVITRASTAKLLQDIGHTIEAANLYLDAIDMQDQRAERKAEADLVIEQAEAGALTFDQAQDKLRQLGLETVEVEKAIAKLLRAMARKVKLPSLDDGVKLYVQGIITRSDLEDLLSRLGYAPKWRQAYLTQAEETKRARSQSSRA